MGLLDGAEDLAEEMQETKKEVKTWMKILAVATSITALATVFTAFKMNKKR